MHRLFIVAGLVAGLVVCLWSAACGGNHPQSPSCAAFVACVAARDAERGVTTNVDRFLEDGACWSAAEEGATACATACARGLVAIATVADAPAVCR
jgi:hypothetical protein